MSRLPPVATVVVCLLAAGCTDTGSRLDDFGDHVVDASVVIDYDARPLDQLPDVSGTFYTTMTAAIAPTSPFHFRFTNVLTRNADGTGTIDVTIEALSADERLPVGDPATMTDVPVTMNGEMVVPFVGTLPGAANPLSSNDVGLDIDIVVTIRDADTICGVANGETTAPVVLDVSGSIVIAVRVAEGAEGMDLPPPRTDCPESSVPDAGPSDAATPDAAIPDAADPDAEIPDAATPDA